MLQSIPTGFWVEEIHGESHCDKYDDEHKVVLPGDRFEGDRVYKGVEELSDYYRDPGDGQAVRSEPIWPDFARIGCQKRRPMSHQSAWWFIEALKRDLQSNIIASKEDEQKRYDSNTSRGTSRFCECTAESRHKYVRDKHNAS